MWYHIVETNELEGNTWDRRGGFGGNETEGGKETVCKTFEELADKRAKAREEARAKEDASRLLAMGKLTYEEIAKCTDLPVEEIKNLADLQLA